MNDMKRDLEELGAQLWPDVVVLRPRSTAPAMPQRRHRHLIEVVATAVVALAVGAGLAVALALGRTSTPRTVQPVPPGSTPFVGQATAAELAAGQWSELPPAPIPPRNGASAVWTGTEVVVWGGYGPGVSGLAPQGAAFNPATGVWRMLPASPLSPSLGQVAVWDGSEVLVWEGIALNPSFPTHGDGAAYKPATNSWRKLAPAPYSAQRVVTAWTGTVLVMLGGYGPDGPAGFDSIHGGAAYDPRTDSWTAISSPPLPTSHSLAWTSVVQAGDRLVAFSEWATSIPCGPACTDGPGGTDVFTYDVATRAWHLQPAATGAISGVDQAFWTGRVILTRGGRWCGGCGLPPSTQISATYDPALNRWSVIAPDPLAGESLARVWPGSALFSIDEHPSRGGTDGVNPADTSAYDAVSGWLSLPPAPSGCFGTVQEVPAVWTGHRVVFYCPTVALTVTAPPQHAGLVFTAGH